MLDNSALINTIYPIFIVICLKKIVKIYAIIIKIQIQKKNYMSSSYLPAILVPIVGIIFPAFAMALLFIYVEKNEIA